MWVPAPNKGGDLRVSIPSHLRIASPIQKNGLDVSPTSSSPGGSKHKRGENRLTNILTSMSALSRQTNASAYTMHAQSLQQKKRDTAAREVLESSQRSSGQNVEPSQPVALADIARGLYNEEDFEYMNGYTPMGNHLRRSSNSFSSDSDLSDAWQCMGCGTSNTSAFEQDKEGYRVCQCGVVSYGKMVSNNREKACAAEDDKTTRADAPSKENAQSRMFDGRPETAEEARKRRNREMGFTVVPKQPTARGTKSTSCKSIPTCEDSEDDATLAEHKFSANDLSNAQAKVINSAMQLRKQDGGFELNIKIENKQRLLQLAINSVLQRTMTTQKDVARFVRVRTNAILVKAMLAEAAGVQSNCNYGIITLSPNLLAVAGTQFAFEQMLSITPGPDFVKLDAVAKGAHVNVVRIPYNNLIEMRTSPTGMAQFTQLMAALMCITNEPEEIAPPSAQPEHEEEMVVDYNEDVVNDATEAEECSPSERRLKIRDAIVNVASLMRVKDGVAIPTASRFLVIDSVDEWLSNPSKCPFDENVIASILIKAAIAPKSVIERVESVISMLAASADISRSTVMDAYTVLAALINDDQNKRSVPLF